ncbi:DUF899 domain-containing protein [Pseudaminobacter arsenicus]|uniref:DUF899 domain-containing protein n=1 Tax=Borborobacter arsenicus TaxID=1851146 RepID=A0A432V4V8_9HYPH|nr:thioredoxin family protein [Pseudaminobacter arsenicus]RUM97122.1 DUF899 domain-containing protein [Pseudaminobacter arsenicus]
MQPHKIVSQGEWMAAHKVHLAKEKEFTRMRDRLRAERLALPWVRVDKTYEFDTPEGRKTLAELFDGRSQLAMYHFMLGPDWKQGCVGCSFGADHFDGANLHLQHHDVTFLAVSRAPLEKIEAYKKRMGWKFPWVSSFSSDFNYDFNVSFHKEDIKAGRAIYNYVPLDYEMDELHGTTAFYKDEKGDIFRTFSRYARGDEDIMGTYMILDIMPKGRNESGTMDWVKRHDEYESAERVQAAS